MSQSHESPPPQTGQPAPPVVLTIAGFDPSGGAGVVADCKTFTAFGCYATAVVTSLTYQNTMGVYGAAHQPAAVMRAQLKPIIADFQVAALKTGMLPTRAVLEAVARALCAPELRAVPAVVDPVVRSTSGYDLIDDDALAALRRELLPRARVVTPNLPEAERLTGLRVHDEATMRAAARMLRDMGARAVLIKGGHLAGPDALDLLDDDGTLHHFHAARIETTSTHGTGCTLAAAITAALARGLALPAAVAVAKRFVTAAILHAPKVGRGHGPINQAVAVRFTPQGVLLDERLD